MTSNNSTIISIERTSSNHFNVSGSIIKNKYQYIFSLDELNKTINNNSINYLYAYLPDDNEVESEER